MNQQKLHTVLSGIWRGGQLEDGHRKALNPMVTKNGHTVTGKKSKGSDRGSSFWGMTHNKSRMTQLQKVVTPLLKEKEGFRQGDDFWGNDTQRITNEPRGSGWGGFFAEGGPLPGSRSFFLSFSFSLAFGFSQTAQNSIRMEFGVKGHT